MKKLSNTVTESTKSVAYEKTVYKFNSPLTRSIISSIKNFVLELPRGIQHTKDESILDLFKFTKEILKTLSFVR